MIKRRFSLYYFSEVAAVVRVTDSYRIVAEHPTSNVPISDWFHFVEEDVDDDPLVVENDNLFDALALMADELCPGAIHILEQDDRIDDNREQFFTDFALAFVLGEYNYQQALPLSTYSHPVGSRLEQRAKELSE